MNLPTKKMSFLVTVFLLLALVTLEWGCESFPSGSNIGKSATYQLRGCLAKDINKDSVKIAIDFRRDDTALTTAVIKYSGDSLGLKDSLFVLGITPAGHYAPGTDTIAVKDSIRLNASIKTSLPGTFLITNVIPARREKRSYETVQLEWNTSVGSQGWAIVAVKKSQLYAGAGFSQWVGLQSGLATFNPEAFTVGNQPGNEIDTGWYYLYVYSIVGAPDSILAASLLPAPLPGQIADNIELRDLGGHFGTVVVATHDSMRVVAQ